MENRPALAIAYMLVTVALFSVSDAASKWLAPDYSAVQIMWVRAVIALPAVTWFCWRRAGHLGTRVLPAHLLRGSLMLVAWGLFIFALRTMPLADAFAIAFASPIFITLAGRLILREHVSQVRWSAVAVGFIGVLVVMQPSAAGFGADCWASRGATLAWARSTVVSRRITASESSEKILFYFIAISAVLTSFLVPFEYVPVAKESFLAFALTATAGTLGHWVMAEAFRYGEISLLAPFEYFGLVLAIAIGYAIWGDLPTPLMLAGSSLIVGSGLWIACIESRAAVLERSTPAKRSACP